MQAHLKRPHRLLTLLIAAVIVVGGQASPASATHDDDLFELGGGAVVQPGSANIVSSSSQDGPDWADGPGANEGIFDGLGNVTLPAEGVAAAFLGDDLATSSSTDDTMFAGTNKNNDPIATWQWDTGNVPAKDDLSNVYGYAANDTDGDLIVYVGFERLAPEGASHVDVEFNQASVALDKGVPPCGADGVAPPPPTNSEIEEGAPCEFVGVKTVNDALLVMDYENGGRLAFLEVRRWNGSQYELVEKLTPASSGLSAEGCNTADTVCAFANGAAIDGGPWANFNRHGAEIANLPANAFTEFGVNLTELFGTTPCVTAFMGKTRSSPSFNSELMDFAGPAAFPVCGISVEKTGDELGKIGDAASYTIDITNTGAVTLYKESIVDDVLGDLTSGTDANIVSSTCGASLAPGATCTITLAHTVTASDPDPLVNTVDVIYDNNPALTGSNITASDSHSLNLFQPSVDVTKTCDELGKIGDPQTCVIDIENTSSSDSPDLINGTIDDTLTGDLLDPDNAYVTASDCTDTLGVGDSCQITTVRTVLSGDPDPLENTVEVHYNPDGFPNDISDSSTDSTNLFQPSVDVTKTCDELGKIGDPQTCVIDIENTSSSDSPDLINGTIDDTLTGDLLDPDNTHVTASDCTDTLAPGDSCQITTVRTVLSGDADPLENTVEVHYNPDGFPNDISDSSTDSTNLFQPSVRVTKTGPASANFGDTVTYNFTIENTSSSDSPDLLVDSIGDTIIGDLLDDAPAACDRLAAGASCSFTADYTTSLSDPNPLVNVVTVHYHPEGFPNDISDDDDHSLTLSNPRNQLTPTGTECVDYTSDTATELEELERSGSGQLAPGAFIHFAQLEVSGATKIEVLVSSDPTAAPDPRAFDVKLFAFNESTGTCQNISSAKGVTISIVDNVVTYNLTASAANKYKEVVTYTKYSSPVGEVGTVFTFTTEVNDSAVMTDTLVVVDNL